MTTIKNFVSRFVSEEDGATMPEYGLMLALIAIVCILSVTAIGNAADVKFGAAATALQNAGN